MAGEDLNLDRAHLNQLDRVGVAGDLCQALHNRGTALGGGSALLQRRSQGRGSMLALDAGIWHVGCETTPAAPRDPLLPNTSTHLEFAKLSMMTTSQPASTSCTTVWLPMNPVPPVTRIEPLLAMATAYRWRCSETLEQASARTELITVSGEPLTVGPSKYTHLHDGDRECSRTSRSALSFWVAVFFVRGR